MSNYLIISQVINAPKLIVPNDKGGDCSSKRETVGVLRIPRIHSQIETFRLTLNHDSTFLGLNANYAGIYTWIERDGNVVPFSRVGFTDGGAPWNGKSSSFSGCSVSFDVQVPAQQETVYNVIAEVCGNPGVSISSLTCRLVVERLVI